MPVVLLFLLLLPSFILSCNLLHPELNSTSIETAVFAFGTNNFGGLGNGEFSSFSLPQKVFLYASFGKIKKLFQNYYFTLVINDQNQMFAAGLHYFHQSHQAQYFHQMEQIDPTIPLVSTISAYKSRVDVLSVDGTVISMTSPVRFFTASDFMNQTIVDCATGGTFSLYLPQHRRGIFVYGTNHNGELSALLQSNDTIISNLRYVSLDYLLTVGETISFIKSGLFHTIFSTSRNRIFVFGCNDKYQLGLGYTSPFVNEISQIVFAGSLVRNNIISVGATANGCIVLLKSSIVMAFGTSTTGELGSPFAEFGPLKTPTKISDGTALGSYELVQVNVFPNIAFAITKEGLLISWGYNIYGQVLGDVTKSRVFYPERANLEFQVVDAVCDDFYCLGLSSENELYAWGGAVIGTSTSNFNFVNLQELDGKQVIGFAYSFLGTYGIIASDYSLYVWGYNSGFQWGQRGNIVIPIPSLYTSKNLNVSQVSCITTGNEHALFVSKHAKQLYGMGSNYAGQLGDGTTFVRPQPVLVSSMSSINFITTWMDYNCAITEGDGKLYCWGQAKSERPYLFPNFNSLYPLKSAQVYQAGIIAVLRNNKTVWYTNEGMEGPIAISPATLQVKQISCSLKYCLFLSTDNRVYEMGSLLLTTGLNETEKFTAKVVHQLDSLKEAIIGIKVGDYSCYVYTSSQIYGWGTNFFKLLDSELSVLSVFSSPTLLNYTEKFKDYQIVELTISTYTAHVLVMKYKTIISNQNMTDNLYFLLLLLFLIPFTFAIFVFIFIIIIVVTTKRRNKDFYTQLSHLESKSEQEMPFLLPTKYECFKIDFSQIELLQEIGVGASSLVYKARYIHNEIVAIKLFKLTSSNWQSFDSSNFEQEVNLLTQLRHTNIVLFYGATLAKSRVGLVLQYCSNGSLAQFMKKKKLTLKRKIQLLIQLSKALCFLHSKQIIHRDIKMDNILIDENETVKLTDFGLSKLLEQQQQDDQVFMTKGVGTDHMIAPEVTLGQEYDTSADVFSFGIVMIELFIEKVNPYTSEIGKSLSGIGIKVALDPTFRPRLPLEFPIHSCHRPYLLLMQECWKHEKNERPTMQQVLERLQVMEESDLVETV